MKKLRLLNLGLYMSLLYMTSSLAVATNSSANTNNLESTSSSSAAKGEILNSIKTPYGPLTLQQAGLDEPTQLYYNDKLIHLKANEADSNEYGYKLAFVESYVLEHKKVFLIRSSPGGNSLPNRYALLQPSTKDDLKVSKLFNLLSTDDIKRKGNALIIRVSSYLPYAYRNDHAVYTYTISNGLKLTKNFKSDAFYKKVYSKKDARYILSEAKKDSCLDANGSINTAHVCAYGMKYCFMYNSLNKAKIKPKDKAAYAKLESSFKDGNCMQFVSNYK